MSLISAAVVGVAIVVGAGRLAGARIDDGSALPQRAPLVDDCTLPSAPLPCDGAPTTGTVEYRQDEDGTLVVRVTLANARLSSDYPILLGDCGSHEVTTCGTILVGSLKTDGRGAGTAEAAIPLDVLRAASFGRPGKHSARVSLTKPGSVGRHGRPGVLSAVGVEYSIPP